MLQYITNFRFVVYGGNNFNPSANEIHSHYEIVTNMRHPASSLHSRVSQYMDTFILPWIISR